MPATLTKDIVLIHSFETAAVSPVSKVGAVRVPLAANSSANSPVDAKTSGSIFRTTDK